MSAIVVLRLRHSAVSPLDSARDQEFPRVIPSTPEICHRAQKYLSSQTQRRPAVRRSRPVIPMLSPSTRTTAVCLWNPTFPVESPLAVGTGSRALPLSHLLASLIRAFVGEWREPAAPGADQGVRPSMVLGLEAGGCCGCLGHHAGDLHRLDAAQNGFQAGAGIGAGIHVGMAASVSVHD